MKNTLRNTKNWMVSGVCINTQSISTDNKIIALVQLIFGIRQFEKIFWTVLNVTYTIICDKNDAKKHHQKLHISTFTVFALSISK